MLPDLDRKRISRRRFLKAMGIGSLAAVGTIAYGEQTSMDIETVHRELALPNWNADGIRFAFVTDLHADHPEAVARSIQAIRIAQRAKPEAILFGGDYLTSAAPQHLQNLREVMATLGESSIPCYGVMGNHDYWISYFDLVKEAAISGGMRLLRNETVEIGGVRIIGMDDALVKKHRPDLAPTGRNTLALLHEPDFVSEMPPGICLQLSGHSHGGQVCLPGGISVHTPRGAWKYIAGFYEKARNPLYVSRGVGTTGPNWRLFCRPEVTILTLKGS